MKKQIMAFSGIALIVLGLVLLFPHFYNIAQSDNVEAIARRASVQPVFYIPVLKAYFAEPIEEKAELTEEDIKELISKKIEEAIEKEREEQKKERYQVRLTDIEVWGFESPSKTEIPLGALAPEWAKFPKRVLVVYRVEKKEITAWEKEYEKDVLAISEMANVSPSQAKSIINKLRIEGYTISKEEIDTEAEVRLFWFDDGWDDEYPLELDWKVAVLGEEDSNLITGYDPRGILIVRPIPEKSDGEPKRVYVKAGYLDLKDEFKPKPDEIARLEGRVETLEEELEEKKRELEDKKEVEKRDIGKATWGDVAVGTVKIEEFWFLSASSGVFLGNMRVRDGFYGFTGWDYDIQYISGESKAAILTNAHVANAATTFEVWVSENKELMWIFFPAYAYIRFTQESDTPGSPAQILAIDRLPVSSVEYDTAIMVTTSVPGYQKHKAVFGNSDKVRESDEVIMVGNPIYLQKFLTRGVVSNKSYDAMKSILADQWLQNDISRKMLNLFSNSNFWFDTPIGIGGTSGSGVWATEGSEKGKVVALHNIGMAIPMGATKARSKGKEVYGNLFIYSNETLAEGLKGKRDMIFKDFPHQEAVFECSGKDFGEKDDSFILAAKKHGVWMDVSGMNAGIPINKVKQYLQERGLDPGVFDWESLPDEYWEK